MLDSGTLSTQASAIAALLNQRLRIAVDGTPLGQAEWSVPEPIPDRQSLRLRTRYVLEDTPGVITVSAYMFPYDPVHQTFVNVYEAEDVLFHIPLARLSFRVRPVEEGDGTERELVASA